MYPAWEKTTEKAAILAMKNSFVSDEIANVAQLLRGDIKKFDKKLEVSFNLERNCEINTVPKWFLSVMALLR